MYTTSVCRTNESTKGNERQMDDGPTNTTCKVNSFRQMAKSLRFIIIFKLSHYTLHSCKNCAFGRVLAGWLAGWGWRLVPGFANKKNIVRSSRMPGVASIFIIIIFISFIFRVCRWMAGPWWKSQSHTTATSTTTSRRPGWSRAVSNISTEKKCHDNRLPMKDDQ